MAANKQQTTGNVLLKFTWAGQILLCSTFAVLLLLGTHFNYCYRCMLVKGMIFLLDLKQFIVARCETVNHNLFSTEVILH